jgi:hypothetical protein
MLSEEAKVQYLKPMATATTAVMVMLAKRAVKTLALSAIERTNYSRSHQ